MIVHTVHHTGCNPGHISGARSTVLQGVRVVLATMLTCCEDQALQLPRTCCTSQGCRHLDSTRTPGRFVCTPCLGRLRKLCLVASFVCGQQTQIAVGHLILVFVTCTCVPAHAPCAQLMQQRHARAERHAALVYAFVGTLSVLLSLDTGPEPVVCTHVCLLSLIPCLLTGPVADLSSDQHTKACVCTPLAAGTSLSYTLFGVNKPNRPAVFTPSRPVSEYVQRLLVTPIPD